jgi:hypothetical protein
VAVEKSANDTAVEHARERIMMRFGRPGGYDFFALDEAPDAKTLVVSGTTSETRTARSIGFLEAFLHHSVKQNIL